MLSPLQLCAAVHDLKLPLPSNTWASLILDSRQPPPPVPALIATAKARLLASDWSNGEVLDVNTKAFPMNLANPNVVESRLPHDVFAQVLDVENLTRSRWQQTEELESTQRGERMRGREIIQLPQANEDTDNTQNTQNTQGRRGGTRDTHRLVLQDCKGQSLFGLELRRIPGFGIGSTCIGEKVLIKANTVIARGVLLLEPEKCHMLGGKVDAWHKDWLDKRIQRLRQAAALQNSHGLPQTS